MPKILARTGVSLASVYDVKGSIAGVENLESRDVSLAHEMGGTIFSERFTGAIRRADSGTLAQTITWNVVLANLPAGIWRVLGCSMFANTIARTLHAAVLLRNPNDGREIPILVFDSVNDTESRIQMEDDGNGVTTHFLLNSTSPIQSPNIGVGAGQRPPNLVGLEIAFRGITATFGAGTVNIRAIIHLGLTHVGGGISSLGLPIPGW